MQNKDMEDALIDLFHDIINSGSNDKNINEFLIKYKPGISVFYKVRYVRLSKPRAKFCLFFSILFSIYIKS